MGGAPCRDAVSIMSTGVVLTRVETLALYRHLLRAAQVFPSRRRTSIISDIRSEFRVNVSETDPEKLRACVQEAECALFELTRFNANKKEDTDWGYSQVGTK